MTGHEMVSRLDHKLSVAITAIETLEKERAAIMPASLADEPTAVKRMKTVRSEIAGHQAMIQDLDRAIADLRPRVDREVVAAHHARRQVQAANLQAWMDAMASVGERIDAAITALAEAAAAAGPIIDRVRTAAGLITMQNTGADIGAVAINQMLAINAGPLPPLPDILLERLACLAVVPLDTIGGQTSNAPPVAETMAAARRIFADRVQRALQDDVEQARRLDEPAPALALEAA